MNGIGAKTGNMMPSPNDTLHCEPSGWYPCEGARAQELYIEKKKDMERNAGHTSGWYDEHYQGDIQPIEYMQAQFSKQEFIGGLLFNIIKYSSRLGKKDDPLKEARKILRYSQWLVEALEGKKINPRE